MDTIPLDNSSANESLLMSRLNNLQGADKIAQPGKVMTPQEKAKAEQAARGFESIFINMWLKEMKQAMLNKEGQKEGDLSFGSDTLQGYTDMALSDEFSKVGKGIGIAELIYKQLTGGDGLKNITSKSEPVIVPKQKLQNQSSAVNNQVNIPDSGGNFEQRVATRLEPLQGIITEASKKFNVPDSLIKAVITAESAAKPNAVSSAGAKGLMQLMDSTSKDLGVNNPFNPSENIMGGAQYLRSMLDKFDGKLDLALAAYNAGPGNVQKYGGVPPFNETQSYIKKVQKYNDMFKNGSNINNNT